MTTYQGTSGNDAIQGSTGNDIMRGGAGADRVAGGKGNDTFLFEPGDLIDSLVGVVDQINDFQGAGTGSGSWSANGSEQDMIVFHGFGAGSHFDYIKTAAVLADGSAYLYYHLVDPTNSANNGYVVVHSMNGALLDATRDFAFH